MLKNLKSLLIIPALALGTAFVFTNNASAIEFDPDTLPSGQFEIDMYQPVTYDDVMIMNEAIDEQANGWGITSGGTEYCNETYTSCKLVYHGTDWTDDYYPIHYNYNPDAKAAIDEVLTAAGLTTEHKQYHVYDLELMYAWVANTLGLDADISTFSSELRAALNDGNLNFAIDPRMGCEAPFLTCRGGIGKVTQLYNGNQTLYYVIPSIEVLSENIFYVPDETADDGLAEALEARINGIYGENSVSVEATDNTVADFVEEDDLAFLDHLNSLDEKVFNFTIHVTDGLDAGPFQILIRKDSSKMFVGSVNSRDLATGVLIRTDAPFFPADTVAYAELNPNQEEVVTELLGSDNYVTYELGLVSNAFGEEVYEAGEYNFTVGIPVPESLAGKVLSAYWGHRDEETGEDVLEEHYANIDPETGLAVYETDHFSTYILAESSADRPAETIIPNAPNTSRGSEPSVMSSIASTMLALVILITVGGMAYAAFAPRVRNK